MLCHLEYMNGSPESVLYILYFQRIRKKVSNLKSEKWLHLTFSILHPVFLAFSTSVHMPYWISWNTEHTDRDRRVLQTMGQSENPVSIWLILGSSIAQDKSQNHPLWFWSGLVIPTEGSMISKQKHYQNHQHCELLSMSHENQSGGRKKKRTFCSFYSSFHTNMRAESNCPNNSKACRSQTWPTSFITCLWKFPWIRVPAFVSFLHQTPKLGY